MRAFEELIQQSIAEGKANVEIERKRECEKRLEIYGDQWDEHLRLAVEGQFHSKTKKNVAQLLDTSQNILKIGRAHV